MKKIFQTVLFSLIITTFTLSTAYSQCKGFDEASCKEKLSPYINYGNYISTNLTDGEYAELNMTFYSGQQYRLVICGMENVPKLEFRIFDGDHNLIFKNKDADYTRTWDFKLESSQQLIIAIIVPETKPSISGCVAIFNGIKN